MALGLSTVVQSYANTYVGSGNATTNAVNQFYAGLAAAVNPLVLTNLPVRAITQYGNFLKAATPFLKAFGASSKLPRMVAFTTIARGGNVTWPYGG